LLTVNMPLNRRLDVVSQALLFVQITENP